jgi:hypothetical protein
MQAGRQQIIIIIMMLTNTKQENELTKEIKA